MALASQSARVSSSGRLYTSRRGRRRINRPRRFLGVIALIALTLAAGWWWMSDTPAPAAADTGGGAPIAQPRTPIPSQAVSADPRINFTDEARAANAAPSHPEPFDDLTMGDAPSSTEPTPAAQPSISQSTTPTPGSGAVAALLADADNALAANEPLIARLLLNRALHDPRASASDQGELRTRLTALNEEILFSPRVVEGDPLTERYIIKPNDSLAKITSAESLQVDWRLLQRINQISDPRRIRIGQTIKLIRGPFDAVIDKSDYRLDLYARLGEDGSTDARMYIASFPVGLGQYGSTPVGSWIVRRNSKLIDPPWTNPQTGQRYSAGNPDNPIGERWIGLEGTNDDTMILSGYGIHGTIDPQSVGTEASMGCVRMRAEDVNLVYEMLTEGVSRVEIQP